MIDPKQSTGWSDWENLDASTRAELVVSTSPPRGSKSDIPNGGGADIASKTHDAQSAAFDYVRRTA